MNSELIHRRPRDQGQMESQSLAAIVESSDDAIIGKNLNGIIITWNKGAEQLFYYTAEEITGKPMTMIIPPDRFHEERSILQRIRRGERVIDYETIGRRKDGSLFEISLTVSPVRDADGKIIGASKIARDITERKRAEKEIQLVNRELEQHVNDRTRELKVVGQRLRESQVLAAVGTAAAKIIHDMASPLSAISTSVQLQERYLATGSGPLDQLIAGTTRDLKHETARIQTLVEELRQFSRPLQLKIARVNLAKMVTEIIREMALRHKNSGVEFAHKLPEDLPPVAVDDEKLDRVLSNLCKNAIEAMPEGGKLIVRCFTREEKIVVTEIEDTGCGIPTEMNVFEPFTTSKANGWGLGLSIVQHIISAHNGTIEYVSEPGKGTTFTICLPAA